MSSHRDVPRRSNHGFTLVELLVTVAIIAILSSLSLAGLSVARQRVKADRTELTIRKIHEVIMPHYERFLTRTFPLVSNTTSLLAIQHQNSAAKAVELLTKRRALVLELPDGWADLIDAGTFPPALALNPPLAPFTSAAERMRSIAAGNNRAGRFSDAECLWAIVMRGGFADPAIVENFREDEFGDKDNNGAREFIDGWGNPIRFLRWAPAFVSRYQPDPASTAVTSHDVFDQGGRDPLARTTLFPLIFSCGPDGRPAIACRDDEGQFSYPRVAFDPYFATTVPRPDRRPPGSPVRHLSIIDNNGLVTFFTGPYQAAQQYTVPFGTPIAGRESDDVHNHAMSR